jgi:hypothetical protein
LRKRDTFFQPFWEFCFLLGCPGHT